MEQKLKDLLVKDLCARLPYSFKVKRPGGSVDYISAINVDADTLTVLYNGYTNKIEKFVPYLRPMSSMTKDEHIEYYSHVVLLNSIEKYDWLNAHHFDYRGLIDKYLALEAPDGMYDSEKD